MVASYYILIIDLMASCRHQKGKLTSQILLVHKHPWLMHLQVSFMGKRFIWRFPVLLGFHSIKSSKTAVVVVFFCYSCLQPQLRLGCVHNSTRMGAQRCKASDNATFSQFTPEKRLASGFTVPVSSQGVPYVLNFFPGKGGPTWSKISLTVSSVCSEQKIAIPTQETVLNSYITCDRKLWEKKKELDNSIYIWFSDLAGFTLLLSPPVVSYILSTLQN